MKLIIILLFISSIILFFSFSEAYAEDDHEIPEWLKTIALWWINDKVDDIEFVTAIQYLIKDKIIILPETSQQSEYPRWLTNNAGLWAAKIFTNSDFNFDPEYVKKKIYPCREGSNYDGCVEEKYNSYGFRGDEFEKEKPHDTYRIFTVGGSTTFGVGANGDETWPANLQKIINKEITEKKIEVINFGAYGAKSESEYILIKNKIISLNPDLIIMYDGWNDFQDIPVEKTIRSWESVCKLGENERFDVIIIVQPLADTYHRVLTEQEITNTVSLFPNSPYLQESEQYVAAFEVLDEGCTKTADFRRIFDYVQEPIFYDGGHTMSFGNKIIAENVFSVISPIFGKTYSVIHNNLDSAETSVVYAVGADLSGKNFDNLNLQNAVFDKANLSNTSFKNANIDGARFVFADLSNSNLLDRTDLSNINLAGTDLSNINLKGKDLTGTILTGAILSHTNLSGVDLSGKDLTGTTLRRADLSYTNLSGVDLSGKDLTGTILTGVDLSGKDLSNITLKDANLENTSLQSAMLLDANLDSANLTNADLRNTVLVDANLSNAILTGSNLEDAILTNTILDCIGHPLCV